IQLGVDPGQLLVVEFNRGAQLADFSIDLVDLELQLPDFGPPLPPQTRYLVFEPQYFAREFTAPALTKAFGNRLIEFGNGQGLRLNFTRSASVRVTIEERFDLVPACHEEEQATDPGGHFNRVGGDLGEHRHNGE